MPTYSRGEIVSTLTTFYQFLTTMYIPTGDILHPPPGGWPEITIEKFAFLGKTDRAIDLLRYIPYIRRDSEFLVHQVEALCVMIDYRGGYTKKHLECGSHKDYFDPYEEVCTLPAHVITLAQQWQGRNGSFLFLDTERATITHYSPTWPTGYTDLSQIVPEGSTEYWREQATYTIPDFFEQLKQGFLDLDLLPTDDGELVGARRGDAQSDAIEAIWRAHGWPSATYFDKYTCLEEVRKTRAKLDWP